MITTEIFEASAIEANSLQDLDVAKLAARPQPLLGERQRIGVEGAADLQLRTGGDTSSSVIAALPWT